MKPSVIQQNLRMVVRVKPPHQRNTKQILTKVITKKSKMKPIDHEIIWIKDVNGNEGKNLGSKIMFNGIKMWFTI